MLSFVLKLVFCLQLRHVTTRYEVISYVYLSDMDIHVYTGLTRLCAGYAASMLLLVGLGVLIPRIPLSGGEP